MAMTLWTLALLVVLAEGLSSSAIPSASAGKGSVLRQLDSHAKAAGDPTPYFGYNSGTNLELYRVDLSSTALSTLSSSVVSIATVGGARGLTQIGDDTGVLYVSDSHSTANAFLKAHDLTTGTGTFTGFSISIGALASSPTSLFALHQTNGKIYQLNVATATASDLTNPVGTSTSPSPNLDGLGYANGFLYRTVYANSGTYDYLAGMQKYQTDGTLVTAFTFSDPGQFISCTTMMYDSNNNQMVCPEYHVKWTLDSSSYTFDSLNSGYVAGAILPLASFIDECGDGVTSGAEQCDDANSVADDGCDSCTLTDPQSSCLDGVLVSHSCSDCAYDSDPNGATGEPESATFSLSGNTFGVTLSSFGMDNVFVGEDEAGACTPETQCLYYTDLTNAPCVSTMESTWDWSVISSVSGGGTACSGITVDDSSADTIVYTVPVSFTRNELGATIYGSDFCVEPQNTIFVEVSFPRTVRATTSVSVVTTLEGQSTVINEMKFTNDPTGDQSSGRLDGSLLVGIPYPFVIVTPPACAVGPDSCPLASATTVTETNTAGCSSGDTGACFHTYDFSVDGNFCDVPTGDYTMYYTIGCRDGAGSDCDANLGEVDQSLTFTVPDIYTCTPLDIGTSLTFDEPSLTLETRYIDADTDVVATQFSKAQRITLRGTLDHAVTGVDITAGHISYVRACIKSTLADADSTDAADDCDAEDVSTLTIFEDAAGTSIESSDFNYDWDADIIPIEDPSLPLNSYDVDVTNQRLQASFQFDSDFLGTGTDAFIFFRLEMYVVDMEYATKGAKQVQTNSVRMVKGVAIGSSPNSSSSGSDTTTAAAAAVVGAVAMAGLVGIAVHRRKRIALGSERSRVAAIPSVQPTSPIQA